MTPSNAAHQSEVHGAELQWASALLRLGIGSLLLSAALIKVPGGIAGTIAYYSSLFEQSILPLFWVKAHASVIMFVEFALGIWLLSGYRLPLAWKASSLLLVSLAVGMVFAGKYDVASDNYLYVLVSCLGLFLARYDRWALGR